MIEIGPNLASVLNGVLVLFGVVVLGVVLVLILVE